MTERAPWDYERPVLQHGEHIGWVDRRGVTHYDTLADHRELIPSAVWDAAVADDESRDILDEIDAVLAEGEPRTGFDYDDPTYPKCPRGCGRQWHGMAVTERIERMAARGAMDLDYRYDEDDSRVLCPAPDFVGPVRPRSRWQYPVPPFTPRSLSAVDIQFDQRAMNDILAAWRRAHDQMLAALAPALHAMSDVFLDLAAAVGDLWQLPHDPWAVRDDPFDPSAWLDWQPLGELAGPAEFTPLVIETASGFRWSGRAEVIPEVLGPIADRFLLAGRVGRIAAEQLVADALREHERARRETPESVARKVLAARPIRIAGARPIPRDLAEPPEQHGPPSRGRNHRRRP